MALSVNATSDYVDHGSGASLDGLTAWTLLLWWYPTGLTTFEGICNKGDSSAIQTRYMQTGGESGGSYKIATNVVYSGTNCFYAGDFTVTDNKWWYCVAAFDDGASANDYVRLYTGDLTTRASAESITYNDDPTGTITSDAAGSFRMGKAVYASAGSAISGDYAWVALYNTRLTAKQIQAHQYQIWAPMYAGCVLFSHYFGTGTQADLSGNGNNGTVSSMTAADHVPLLLSRPHFGDLSYTVTVAGRTTKNTDSHPLGVHTGMAWRLNQP